MQVSATLIAAQQAAREARARLNVPQARQAPAPQFAAALEKATGGFAPLPLKQTASPVQTAAPQPPTPSAGQLGQHINIVV